MRLDWFVLLLTMLFSLCSSVSWGETALFNAFFDQRELVASVAFEPGSNKINNRAAVNLEETLKQIRNRTCESRLIRIEGFSGREGDDEAAFRLSLNRAYSVARLLEAKGVSCLVGINGYGNLRAGQAVSEHDQRVEIASYPKMFLFDFNKARYVDLVEVKLP